MTRSRNFFRSGAVNVVFQVLFLGLLYLVGRDLGLAWESPWGEVVLVALVLVPSVIWTSFFYLQDRVEPEPTGYVTVSFLAGMAAAAFAGLPLLEGLLELQTWIYGSVPVLVVASVCLFGGVTAFLFYLVLRHGFLPTREFDEPADGLVYGAFVGSGYAFVQSFVYLADQPDFTVFALAYTATTNVLVYASVGALLGDFVARPKFDESAGGRTFLAGVGLAALLLGTYRVANEFIFLSGVEGAFWLSFALSVLFAAALLAVAYLRLQEVVSPDLQRSTFDLPQGIDWGVAGLFFVLLATGVLTERQVRADTVFQAEEASVTFAYPFAVHELPVGFGTGLEPARLALGRVVFHAGILGMGEDATVRVAFWDTGERARVESIDPTDYLSVGDPLRMVSRPKDTAGRRGLRVRYAFVDSASTVGGDLPRMVWGVSDLVPRGERVYAFSVEAGPSQFESAERVYGQLVDTVDWE